MNKVILIGNLGGDPKTGETRGTTWGYFSLATNERFEAKDGTRGERVDWHNVKCFNGLAKTLEHLTKGDRVMVEGKLRTEERTVNGEKKWVTYVQAFSIEWIKVKKYPARPPGEDETELPEDAQVPTGIDDDIPF
jgi:single-strand DNA-binding protein